MNSERIKGHIFVLIANIIFGAFFPISKYLLNADVSSVMLTMARFSGATFLLWILSIFLPDNKITLRALWELFLLGFFGIFIGQWLFLFALGHTSPVDASVIVTISPLTTLIVSAIVLGDSITLRKIVGIAIGATGAIRFILSNAGDVPVSQGSTFGNILMLSTTIFGAIYFVASKPVVKRYGSITMMKWIFLYCTIMFIPYFYVECADELVVLTKLDVKGWAALLYIVVCSTFLTYILLPAGIKRMRPTTVSMYIYVQPIVASVIAISMGQDTFSWGKLLAALFVFSGVYLVTSSPRELDKSSQ